MSVASRLPASWLAEFLLLAALWGASFLFMRIAVPEFGALCLAFMRVSIAAMLLLPVLIWQEQWPALRHHWKSTMTMGMLNSGIPFACFAYALLTINTGLSAILNATAPLFGALVAWFWLKDKLSVSQALGLLIGFCGVLLLAWDEMSNNSGAPLWAIAACLLGTLCYGFSANYAKRHFANIPALTTACGSQIGASLGLLLPALWLWPAAMPSSKAWAATLTVGAFCTALAYILYFRLIAAGGAARAMSVTYLIPVFAILYGMIFLGESVTPWMLGCGVVIVLGTALSTRAFARARLHL